MDSSRSIWYQRLQSEHRPFAVGSQANPFFPASKTKMDCKKICLAVVVLAAALGECASAQDRRCGERGDPGRMQRSFQTDVGTCLYGKRLQRVAASHSVRRARSIFRTRASPN
jgi:hypothetical protein